MSDAGSGQSTLKQVWLFFALAYAISWGSALVLHIIARRAGLDSFGKLMGMAETTFNLGTISDQLIAPVPVVWLLTRMVDFGPTLAGVIAAVIVGGVAGVRGLVAQLFRWRVSPWWYVIAILGPATVMLVAIGLYALIDRSVLGVGDLTVASAIQALLLWLSVRTLMGGGLGEELGWRGFALPRLLPHYGPGSSSLLIGLVWTFWHFPGHLASDAPIANLLGQALFTVPLSYVATWMYLRTGGSVLILALFHGSANAFVTFFERELLPGLRDADGWLLVFMALAIGLSVWAAKAVRQTVAPFWLSARG